MIYVAKLLSINNIPELYLLQRTPGLGIVAPVSPRAIWVKEGDEFTDDQIMIFEGDDFAGVHVKEALIQCPNCKQFH
jgi:hypothetical protein